MVPLYCIYYVLCPVIFNFEILNLFSLGKFPVYYTGKWSFIGMLAIVHTIGLHGRIFIFLFGREEIYFFANLSTVSLRIASHVVGFRWWLFTHFQIIRLFILLILSSICKKHRIVIVEVLILFSYYLFPKSYL